MCLIEDCILEGWENINCKIRVELKQTTVIEINEFH